MRAGDEGPRLVTQSGGEAVAQFHVPVHQGGQFAGAAKDVLDPGLARGAGRDLRAAIEAMDPAVAVAGLAAALFTPSGLRWLNRLRLASYGHLPRKRCARGGGAPKPQNFRFHSNRQNFHHPLPLGFAISRRAIIKTGKRRWISGGPQSGARRGRGRRK